jgi:hypothetical protein
MNILQLRKFLQRTPTPTPTPTPMRLDDQPDAPPRSHDYANAGYEIHKRRVVYLSYPNPYDDIARQRKNKYRKKSREIKQAKAHRHVLGPSPQHEGRHRVNHLIRLTCVNRCFVSSVLAGWSNVCVSLACESRNNRPCHAKVMKNKINREGQGNATVGMIIGNAWPVRPQADFR